jgi:Transglycosylase-like domain
MPVRLDRPVSGKARTHRGLFPGPLHNRPHTLRHYARTDDAFPLSVRGAYATAGARPHRAEPGASARPTKGGAVRIRIALTTVLAVITGLTVGILTLNTRQAPSAHHASAAKHHSVLSNTALAGFSAATTTTTSPTTTTTTTTPPVVKATPAPATAPAPAPATAAPVAVTDATSVYTADWACIRTRESSNRYNSAAAPDGAYGILLSTWRSYGLTGQPYQAPPILQDRIALELYARYGFEPWSSRFACGL